MKILIAGMLALSLSACECGNVEEEEWETVSYENDVVKKSNRGRLRCWLDDVEKQLHVLRIQIRVSEG